MKIVSIQVGKPKTITYKNKDVSTGIFKDPISGPILLKSLGLVGDGQADLTVHGGVDKALYAYSLDTYPEWEKRRPQDRFIHGAFGENLTIDSFDENDIGIGDVFEIGEAVVQVTQPRFPCFELGIKFNDPKIIKEFMQYDRPGIYFRVLKEGHINVGDELKLIQKEKIRLSIVELFQTQKGVKIDPLRLKDIVQIDALPEQWKHHFKEMLDL